MQSVKWASCLFCVSFLAGDMAAQAAESSRARILVDFQELKTVKFTNIQTEREFVESDGNRSLQISTEAAAQWPGVLIEPKGGPWDLSGFYGVAMDVTNPQSIEVRVLLSINNPGADGSKNCNTESITVPPGKTRTLTVPFGMWHGSSGHDLDLSNIVSVMVLLDRPGKAHRFVVDNIRAVPAPGGDSEALFATEYFKSLEPTLGRGVNLGNALEAPREGEWGVKLDERYFDLIKDAGFQSVRIPVRWSAHAGQSAPFRIDDTFRDRVDWAVRQTLERRLYAVVNIHHYEEIMRDPRGQRERFLALWKQIAEHFQDSPPALYFELLNEPHAELKAGPWNEMVADAIAVIRESNPTRKIVVGPVGWNSISQLENLELPENDRNLVVTFHFYSPFQFTHQGASWVGGQSNAWLGTRWSGTPAEKQAVVRDLDRALRWGVENRRPLFMGEFGAYSKADMESRARWTRFLADEAMKRKISFAYWEFCSGFGVFDANANRWNEPLKDALLPVR